MSDQGVERHARTVAGIPIPSEYFCSITHEIMNDPVSAMDGHVYERQAIESWISQHSRSPMTNALLPSKVLIPCHPIKALIQGFLQQHPQVAEECRRISCTVSQYSINNTTPFVPEVLSLDLSQILASDFINVQDTRTPSPRNFSHKSTAD
jgi:hypothetical protein